MTAPVTMGDGPSSTRITARRPFGTTDLSVSPIGLGCARIGGVFQGEPGAFVSLVSASVDAGINFFDTADLYSGGESESILGRAIAGRRNDVVIASKVGYVTAAQRRLAGRIKPILRPVIRALGLSRAKVPAAIRGVPSQDFSPAYIRRAVEASLGRLRTDRIDLLQLHSPPASVIRQGEWSEVLTELKREGKIRHYGIACDTVTDALVALEHPGVASVQVAINLLERAALDAFLPAARARGVAVIARECLANGLLAKERGQIDPAAMFRSPEEAARKIAELDVHRESARRHGVELPALALKFVLAQSGVSTALVGMHRRPHLEDALRWCATNVPASAFAAPT